ncbi:MAG: fumarylacetoacetate hydrolase family protein, partial [Novosphingobium sp.]
MKLATRANGTPDGELIVVSHDGARALAAGPEWPNLLGVMDRWDEAAPELLALSTAVNAGDGAPLDARTLRAPLPRSWQWLDGSAFANHGELMQIAFGLDPIDRARPLMYQGISDCFLGPCDPVPFTDPALGIDFEGEFGVIVDAVPMGVTADEAEKYIRLIVQINDWSLRTLAPIEMKTGFGWVQAKPACSVAPFAVTPDELGGGWRDGRVCLDLDVTWNGTRFGLVNGEEMSFSFPELVAHAARTRNLVAGTIIGSGTVSNADYAQRGSACISERRAIEVIANGAPATSFMTFGDTIRMEGIGPGGEPMFGTIEQ